MSADSRGAVEVDSTDEGHSAVVYIFTMIFLFSAAVYRHESGRYHTFLPFLTYFVSFHFSSFFHYINRIDILEIKWCVTNL
jgi:hypothetical protein